MNYQNQKLKIYLNWIDKNTHSSLLMQVGGVSYDEAYVKIFHTSKSVDEFKERYLDLQVKYEAKFGKIAEQSKKYTQKEI